MTGYRLPRKYRTKTPHKQTKKHKITEALYFSVSWALERHLVAIIYRETLCSGLLTKSFSHVVFSWGSESQNFLKLAGFKPRRNKD